MQKKPTLVILPGWGGSSETWKEFIDLAQDDFFVVCIDLPCFGTEPCPRDVWGVEEYAAYVRQKIDGLGLDRVILLGHSFGGQVAAQFAAAYSERVDRLILSGAAVIRPKKYIRRAVFYLLAKCGKLLFALPVMNRFGARAKKILYRSADSPDYTETTGVKRDIYKKIIRQDLSHLLPKIAIRTLLIWGTHDSYVPIRHAKRIAAAMPNATLHSIAHAKHRLHLEYKDQLFYHIRTFINE